MCAIAHMIGARRRIVTFFKPRQNTPDFVPEVFLYALQLISDLDYVFNTLYCSVFDDGRLTPTTKKKKICPKTKKKKIFSFFAMLVNQLHLRSKMRD